MDTILYLYKKRGLEKPRTEPVGLKTYLLIRIGLDVEEGRWFDKRLEPGRGLPGDAPAQALPVPKTQAEVIAVPKTRTKVMSASEALDSKAGQAGGTLAAAVQEPERKEDCPPEAHPQGMRNILAHPWRTFRRKREERKRQRREQARKLTKEQEEARLRAERESLTAQVEEEMKRLAEEVAELAGDMENCLCVYEDSLRKALLEAAVPTGERMRGNGNRNPWQESRESGQNFSDAPPYGNEARYLERQLQENPKSILPALWRKHFPLEEFHAYTKQPWMEQLFQHAALPHFVILGTAEGIFPMIEAYAVRMKSLRWILTQAEYDQELADFVEDFYTEYGLAIELELLEDAAALRHLRLFCKEAVNMVDFTGEAYMAVHTVPEGSIWLDMFSVEEKKRRLLARDKKVAYISMKELWKIAQKRCNCPVLP